MYNSFNLIDYDKLYEKLEGNHVVTTALENFMNNGTCTIGYTGSSITYNNNVSWIKPIETTLKEIICPGCGSSSIRKTNIPGIVECVYCGKQFTLSY